MFQDCINSSLNFEGKTKVFGLAHADMCRLTGASYISAVNFKKLANLRALHKKDACAHKRRA